MIFNYFKKIFNRYSNRNNHKNNYDDASIIYEDQPITKNYHLYNSNIYDYDENAYLEFHNQFLNNDFFLNDKNKPVLEKIHEDLTYLMEVFQPLLYQNIGLELILTGGALRDFILGKSDCIKDLDITVNISPSYQEFLIYEEFKQPSKLISYLLRQKNIEHNQLSSMNKNFERIDMYDILHHLVDETIEFPGKKFPIQLLVTRNSKQLINHFDFDICKIGLRFFCNHNRLKNTNFPTDIAQYITKLEYQDSFVCHCLNKKLTYHNNDKTEEQVKQELIDHGRRICVKYPDYSLEIFSPNADNYQTTQEMLDKLVSYNKLNTNLKPKEIKTIKKHKI